MEKLRKLITKKNKGESELFTNIFTIGIICIILIFFLDFYSDITYKDNLDLVARKYLLTLETTNTIDGNSILEDIDIATGGDGTKTFEKWKEAPIVKVKINDAVQVIDASDTTIATKYGDMITLIIEGEYMTNTAQWQSAFNKGEEVYIDVVISKASIAKH